MKISLAIMLMLTATVVFGQITTTKVTDKIDIGNKSLYDSTSNYLGGDFEKYVGQDLYVIGRPETLRKYGYMGFYMDYKKDTDKSNVYECDGSIASKYDALGEKYFKVLDVIETEKYKLKQYFLKLQDKLSGNIVYFKYDAKIKNPNSREFPFIVVGFFEKLKQQFIGQVFVFGDKGFGSSDIKTGNKIDFEIEKEWECFDVTINEKTYELSLLFKNNDGQTIAIPYEWVTEREKNRVRKIFTKNEADNYKVKFGKDSWNTILQGKVKIGMTKEMCSLSWGKPNKINETVTSKVKHEQWVYSDNYLYFDNDVLTAIQ